MGSGVDQSRPVVAGLGAKGKQIASRGEVGSETKETNQTRQQIQRTWLARPKPNQRQRGHAGLRNEKQEQ